MPFSRRPVRRHTNNFPDETIRTAVEDDREQMGKQRRIYLLGLSVFTAGSAFCGFSPTISSLIVSRMIQGLGASALMAIGPAILATSFPEKDRGQALGIIGSVVSAGFLTGPLLGGFLVEHLGWRSVFFINLPIGAFGIFLSAKVLERQGRGGEVRLDLLGAFLFFSFITFLLVFLNRVGQSSASFPWEWLFLSLLCLGFLIFVELRSPSPLVNLRLFRRRLFTSSLGASFLSFWMISAHAFVVPFFLQGILKFSPSRVGMLVFPVSLTVLFMAPLGGRFSDRVGVKIPTTLGLIVCSLTIFSFIFLKEGVSDPQILWRQVFLGIGIGFFNPANNSAIIGSLSKEQIGLASSFMALSRNLGLVIGVAFAEMVIAFSSPTHSSGTEGGPPLDGIQNVRRFALFIGLAALFISWGRWGRSGSPSRGDKGIADC